MADEILYMRDNRTGISMPVKLTDNGDGTYALSTTATIGSITAAENTTRWGGTLLTGRDISLDLQGLSDDTATGLLKSIGDVGAGTNLLDRLGEVTASPAANTLLARIKALLTGIVLNTGTNSIGTVGLNTGTNSVGTIGLDVGTNSIGTVGLDAGNESIGAVDLNAGVNTIGKVGIDSAANDVDIASAIPAGTNAIGGIKLVDETGTLYGVKHVENKIRVSSMPYLYDIAEGNVANHKAFTKLGYNADVGSTDEDIWVSGAKYVFPTTAMQMEVVSTSTNDTFNGTGVRTVKIVYLDNTYAEQTETITLDGTNAVQTTAVNILRINSFRAYTTGNLYSAAGTISIRNLNHTTVYRQINQGFTIDRAAIYTVPLGKTLYITSIGVSSGATQAGKNVRWVLRANYDNISESILTAGLFFMPFGELQTQDQSFTKLLEIPQKFPATVDIIVSAISDSAGSICNCSLRGWEES